MFRIIHSQNPTDLIYLGYIYVSVVLNHWIVSLNYKNTWCKDNRISHKSCCSSVFQWAFSSLISYHVMVIVSNPVLVKCSTNKLFGYCVYVCLLIMVPVFISDYPWRFPNSTTDSNVVKWLYIPDFHSRPNSLFLICMFHLRSSWNHFFPKL